MRFVHSGFLGDDWESEYEALAEGDPMYIHQLAEYVRFFRGRPVAIVEHFQPGDHRPARRRWRSSAAPWASATPSRWATRCGSSRPGSAPVEGSVDYLSATIIGVRTDDALYRFAFIPMGGGIYLGHHIYRDDVDVAAATSAWAAWLDGAVAAGQAASTRRRARPTCSSALRVCAGFPRHGPHGPTAHARPRVGQYFRPIGRLRTVGNIGCVPLKSRILALLLGGAMAFLAFPAAALADGAPRLAVNRTSVPKARSTTVRLTLTEAHGGCLAVFVPATYRL